MPHWFQWQRKKHYGCSGCHLSQPKPQFNFLEAYVATIIPFIRHFLNFCLQLFFRLINHYYCSPPRASDRCKRVRNSSRTLQSTCHRLVQDWNLFGSVLSLYFEFSFCTNFPPNFTLTHLLCQPCFDPLDLRFLLESILQADQGPILGIEHQKCINSLKIAGIGK